MPPPANLEVAAGTARAASTHAPRVPAQTRPGRRRAHAARARARARARTPGCAHQMAEGGEIKDLWPLIEESSVECLNQDADHRVEHCFKQGPRDDDAVFLASDCDEQLLINLKFKQPVRLHSVALKALDADKAPKKVKIFVNPVNMSFDSAVRAFAGARDARRLPASPARAHASACVRVCVHVGLRELPPQRAPGAGVSGDGALTARAGAGVGPVHAGARLYTRRRGGRQHGQSPLREISERDVAVGAIHPASAPRVLPCRLCHRPP